MEQIAWLFGEAWEHQRRRQRRLLVALAALTVAVGAAASLTSRPGPVSSPGPPIGAPAGTPVVSPATVLRRDPYMGLRCGSPSPIVCNAIGLAVWLKQPARAVTATINGRRLVLTRSGGDRYLGLGGPRIEFDGYLHPAGLRSLLGGRPVPGAQPWLKGPTPYATVWLLLDFGAGRRRLTHVQLALMPGWG